MERKIIKDKKGTFKERLLKIAGGDKRIINEFITNHMKE